MQRRISVEPFAPGEYLKDYMDGKGWTQDDLADVIGRSRVHVNRLIAGKTAITPDTAHELAKAFGTSPELWMNLQVSYELSLAAKEERDIQRRACVYDKVPVREIAKRGWIKKSDDIEELEENVCRFLKVDAIIADPPFIDCVAARKGTEYGVDTPSQVAWFARAYHLAQFVGSAEYAEDRFDDLMKEMRAFLSDPADVRRVPALLASHGIRLVLIEALPKSRIDGAAFWLGNVPVVALALRYDRIDNFWFTLLHELMHIKHKHKCKVDVDMLEEETDSEIEHVANTEASEYLVPKDKLDSFIMRSKPYFYQTKVIQFAQARGVHPGIVVGQLQRRKQIDWNQLRKLLVKVRSEVIGQAVTDGWGNSPRL